LDLLFITYYQIQNKVLFYDRIDNYGFGNLS